MEYLEIDGEYFINELADKFWSLHLCTKVNGEWKLRHTVNGNGVDD